MSCALFDFIRSVGESEITPRLGFLPDIDDLQHLVRQGAFVFCFCPVRPTAPHRDAVDTTAATTSGRTTGATVSAWQRRAAATHVRRHEQLREAMHCVVDYGWPRAVQRRVLQRVTSVTWRCREAGHASRDGTAATGHTGVQCTTGDDDGPPGDAEEGGAGGGEAAVVVMCEVLHASRWALLDTPFVVERYQLLRVPLPQRRPGPAAPGTSREAVVVVCELDSAAWRRARLVTTVCRVIVPPPSHALPQAECDDEAAALPALLTTAAAAVPRATASCATHHSLAHAFFNTCTALLPIIRPGCPRSWQSKDFVTAAATAGASPRPHHYRCRSCCCTGRREGGAEVVATVAGAQPAHRRRPAHQTTASRRTLSLSSSQAQALSASVHSSSRSSTGLLSGGNSRSSSTEGATSSQLEPSTATTTTTTTIAAATTTTTTTTAAVRVAAASARATRRGAHETRAAGRSRSASLVHERNGCEGKAAEGGASSASNTSNSNVPAAAPAASSDADVSLGAEAATVERRLFAARPQAVRVRAMAMTSLLDGNKIYERRVSVGWRRWAGACGELCRPFIINLVDEVVQYSRCSRAAFYAAVAYLDRFVALCTDPVACCAEFVACMAATGNGEGDGRAERVLYGEAKDVSGSEAATHAGHDDGDDDDDAAPDEVARTRTFFTQVIAVCVMLGCKVTDLYPPRVSKLLICLRSNAQITPADFVALELFVLGKLNYDLHTVTVNEVVDTLLYLGGGAVAAGAEAEAHYRRLHELHHPELPYTPDAMALRAATPRPPSPLLCQAPHGAKGHATSEERSGSTRTDGHSASCPACGAVQPCSNEVWGQFCYLARFLCDLVIRGQRPTPPATAHGDSPHADVTPTADGGGSDGSSSAEEEDELLANSPCLVGLAIVAVSAELHHLVLPAPLLHLLPCAPQSCLCSGRPQRDREHHASDDGLCDGAETGDDGGGADAAACGGEQASLIEAAAEGAAGQTMPHADAASCPCVSAKDAVDGDVDGLCGFPVRYGEDDYALLEYFAWLFCVAYHIPRQGLPCATASAPHHHHHHYSHRRRSAHDGAKGEPHLPSSSHAQLATTMRRVMAEVYKCYHHARDVSCDTLLQKRYRSMLLPSS